MKHYFDRKFSSSLYYKLLTITLSRDKTSLFQNRKGIWYYRMTLFIRYDIFFLNNNVDTYSIY